MAAPGIAAFGDGSHAPGASGLAVQGGGFGAFPGHVWIYQNADRTGNADELTVTAWNGVEATVTIPGSLTNTAGTRYLFLQRSDLAWSNAFAFTLESASGINGSVSKTLGALTLTSAAALALAGSTSKTLGNVTSASVAALALQGTLNATLGALTASAIGAQSTTGNVAVTLGALTSSAAGAVALTGALSQTLSLTLSAVGDLESGVEGTAAVQLESVGLTSEGDLALTGSVVVTLGAVTLSTNRNLQVPSRRLFRVPSRGTRIYRVA